MISVIKFLDQDQKDVLKSSSITILLSACIAQFLDAALLLAIIIFPLQFIITGEVFAHDEVIKNKDLYLDKKAKKLFKESTALFITFGGLGLTVLSVVVSACLTRNSFLALFVLFVPLFVTRAIVFCLKLPLSVMYCLLYGTKQAMAEHKQSYSANLASGPRISNANHSLHKRWDLYL